MIKGCESRYCEWTSKCVQEVRVLVANTTRNGWIYLINKVVVVAMQLVWVDADDRA
jgi:hypothetical protein